jgi:8-amino-7-oxononanoate synthase
VDFASNDYLGLADHPRIVGEVIAALRQEGTGATASRSVSGNHRIHEQVEARLATLKGTEASLLFSSGYMANLGAIPALCDKQDAVYSDALNHASIIDACRLSRATTHTFPHGDLAVLADLLERDRGKYRRRLIVVEGVYSMDGDIFPLAALVPLARRYDSWIYLDDAHGTGVLGSMGQGTADQCQVSGSIDITMGTLDKALGVTGAFVAGSSRVREILVNRARTFIFTTAGPPALVAGIGAALDVATGEGWRRERLRGNVSRMMTGLRGLGRTPPATVAGHIIPIMVGEARRTLEIGGALLERGFLVGAIRPPSVPPGTSRLRITLNALHSDEQIDALLSALSDLLGSRVAPPVPGD